MLSLKKGSKKQNLKTIIIFYPIWCQIQASKISKFLIMTVLSLNLHKGRKEGSYIVLCMYFEFIFKTKFLQMVSKKLKIIHKINEKTQKEKKGCLVAER